jgi:hypothetical protein
MGHRHRRSVALQIIDPIEAGRHREALLTVLLPPPPSSVALAPAWTQALPAIGWINRLKRRLGRPALRRWQEQAEVFLIPGSQLAICDRLDFYFRRSGVSAQEHYDYFVFRFSQPRHLTALAFASLIRQPKKPVLDLACGFGHVTRHLLPRAKDQLVIGVDHNFFGLYIAKNWIASEAKYVCVDADASLPFRDGAFSTAFCSDAFETFEHKVTCIRELKRLTQDDGHIMLIGVRNRLVKEALHPKD